MDFPCLERTPIWKAFSEYGKNIFQPNGVFYWSGRAKNEAKINGTVGAILGPEMELEDNDRDRIITFYIPMIREFIQNDPQELVPYTPITGNPQLQEKWMEWIIFKGKNARNLPSGVIDLTGHTSLPVIVPGLSFGIFTAVRLFLDPGEKIILPDKHWENYIAIIERQCGARITTYPTFAELNGKQQYNLDGLREKIEQSFIIQQKAVVLLNFPSNPTGYVPDTETIKKMKNFLVECVENLQKPIVVLCDDAYEGYVYDDSAANASVFYELTNLHELIIPIKIDGATKEMLMYGGRIGAIALGLHDSWSNPQQLRQYCIEFENKVKGTIRSTISNSNTYTQTVVLKMLQQGFDKILESRQKVVKIIQERYELMRTLLSVPIPGITMDPSGGAFFLLLNLDRKVSAIKFNEHLLRRYQTGFIPIVDEKNGVNALRIAFSSIPVDQIAQCVENIKNAAKDLF
ncbi:MAG: aminotransferase class I/II-fold pyridoxal phosphate-dependent enzyme [Candidatus Lokiarchaeota archaeon]|nr:aminotransferase class I/II-fold pyridoxal phosphate-dependent enzyme [Candidatus Lokiarchaeota archaeon]